MPSEGVFFPHRLLSSTGFFMRAVLSACFGSATVPLGFPKEQTAADATLYLATPLLQVPCRHDLDSRSITSMRCSSTKKTRMLRVFHGCQGPPLVPDVRAVPTVQRGHQCGALGRPCLKPTAAHAETLVPLPGCRTRPVISMQKGSNWQAANFSSANHTAKMLVYDPALWQQSL
jgi:hypothetical protein